MDRNFAKALALVLKSEGGWSDNPKDPGGATMKGVTLANFRRYVKADATKDDLRHITDAQVATVYRRFYWDAVSGAELPDGVDYATFDFAVNSGPGRAAKYLQAVVGVQQDGRIGPATVKAAGAKPAAVVIDALCDARLAFLKRLDTWPTFGKGWSDRVKSVRGQAIQIAAAPPPIVIPLPVPKAAPDTVVVVTQKGNEPPVVTPIPQPSVQPTVPKSKTGWALLAAIIAAIAAAFARLHFGG
ncbi:hypothetical protein FJV76_14240 [Mesorhizobium sp. WSM4303]|uniref:glycoside hydrolase family 108 protein n=1 Tax=Mesorhizobium sp. WSM4303 TaxID=2589887 RepID=UPI00115E44E7|nr:glycosyl hydrolase 108 family protein [Mesorhizobium sp. WSM4303]TRD03793.1 hypothetical protein FJV76_14240 [Mesorhizobium sp. WSM4303]